MLFQQIVRARQLLAAAEALSGLALAGLARQGPRTKLTRPAVLEPLLTVVGCAYVDGLLERGLRPDLVAGYSAGEVAALYAAGVLTAEVALQIAVWRGRILEGLTGPGLDGAMLGLYGIATDTIEQLIAATRPGDAVAVAARNGRRHLTLTGATAALAGIERQAVALGALSTWIEAAGPWHSAQLADASQELLAKLQDIPFHPPRLPVFMSAGGTMVTVPQALREALAVQWSRPVLWDAMVAGMLAQGVGVFLEVGPGRVLTGLLSQMELPAGVRCYFLERPGGVTSLFKPGFIDKLKQTG